MSAQTSPVRRYRVAAALLAAAAVLAAFLAAQSSSALSASAPATPAVKTHSKTRDYHVSTPGTYALIVTLPATKATEVVSVFAGKESARDVTLNSSQGDTLELFEKVKHHTLGVRVLSYGPNVHFTVGRALQPSPTASPPVATPTGTSGATGPTSPTGPVTGPYNTLVWSDDFNGPAGSAPNPANWSLDSWGGCGTGTLSTNTTGTANAQQDGQGLAITATGPSSDPPYSSAQIDSGGLFSFTYGRIEARIAVAAGQGICSAFWLLADDGEQVGWPNGGEIDVMEAIGDLPSQSNGFLHGPITSTPSDQNDQQWNGEVNSVTPLAGTYHTYGVIWKPNSLTWTIDGVPFASATPATLDPTATWVFNGHPFHILLDEAIGGWPGNPNSSTVFPAVMRVAWVHVYQ